MNLRPYQQRAIEQLRACYRSGKRAPVLVLPTGAGKTVVAAAIIRSSVERGGRVLFLVHRQELLEQSLAKLAAAGIDRLRVIRAGADVGGHDAPVAVASIPTLTRWTERQPPAELVIIDEAHHVVAKTWRRLTDVYATARLLGLTATPQRADGKPLGDIFDAIVVGSTVRELTDAGHLVPCQAFAPPGELDAGQLAQSPAAAYARHGGEERAVVFCASVAHATLVAAEFAAAGVPCGVVHGAMGAEARRRVLAELEAGALRVVASCHVLTEGWDSPRVSVCILARRPQHVGLYLQMVGRVLRPAPGKQRATLIDLCGASHAHGLPDAPREYTLDGQGIAAGAERESIRQCLACGGVFRAGPAECPMCGELLPVRPVEPPRPLGLDLVDVAELPKLATRAWTLAVEAKFPGTCRACSRRIRVGQRIQWTRGAGARHAEC